MKRIGIVLLIVVVLAAGWLVYDSRRTARAQLDTDLPTAPVTRMDIDSIVTATGSLMPRRNQQLAFGIAGRVAEVLVDEGDVVEEGQVLARLDTQDLQLNLQQAEAALAVAEATLERARRPATEEEIAAAEAQVRAAEASLADLRRGPSESDRRIAELNVDQARNTLYGAQGNRDALAGNPVASGGSLAQAEAQVLNAEIGVLIAELNRDKLLAGPDASAIRAAEAQLAQAQSTLARLRTGPTPEDIRVSEAQVAQARVSVEAARARLSDATLAAPFSGTIASWNVHPGDNVSPAAPVGNIVDGTEYHLDVTIDETEIGKVAPGQRVRVVLDAYPERELTGEVESVSLLGSASQGIVVYTVRVRLSPADVALRPLMTAAVDIVVATNEQALVIPNRALRRDDRSRYVEVLSGDGLRRVDVTTGLSNDQVTEILSGLTEGQEVVVGQPRENPFAFSPFGG